MKKLLLISLGMLSAQAYISPNVIAKNYVRAIFTQPEETMRYFFNLASVASTEEDLVRCGASHEKPGTWYIKNNFFAMLKHKGIFWIIADDSPCWPKMPLMKIGYLDEDVKKGIYILHPCITQHGCILPI